MARKTKKPTTVQEKTSTVKSTKPNKGFTGHKWTPEQRAKFIATMRARAKGKKVGHKKVVDMSDPQKQTIIVLHHAVEELDAGLKSNRIKSLFQLSIDQIYTLLAHARAKGG